MKKNNGFVLQIVGAVVLLMFGSSAFAKSHHSRGPSFSRPSFHHSAPRFAPRSFSGHSFGSHSFRGPSFRRSVPSHGRSSFNNGSRFFGRGRIDRIAPFRGGYRVWLGGWGYPFFVPYRFYNPFRFRIGLSVGFNAFYDPLGYYSVYDSPRDEYGSDDSYRNDADASASVVRGTVDSVDLQTGIVIIRDNRSRRTVSALLPPRDNRVDDIRPGDFIELSGEWVRGKRYEFDADRMDRFERSRNR